MSSAQSLSVIIDDKRTDSILLSGADTWTGSRADQWFNGTSQSPTYALGNSGKFGTLQMKFEGTSVAFFGTTPPSSSSQNMTVSIDGAASYNTSYADPNPQTYRQWYQSPKLAEGSHNLTLSNIAGTAFDFAVVTVGKDTPLAGQTVIVDNDDSGFKFDGRWRRSQEQFNSGPNPDGLGYRNTTHETTYVGSTFTYQFSGISAAIYGIFTWSNIGLISLTFTLDGQSLPQTYRVNANTPQFVSEIGQQQNFLFYSYDFLPSGAHTLVVNVTECVNQTFSFDYITYTPSFATLASMPDLSQSTDTPDNAKSGSSKMTSKSAIIAGAAGGLLLILLLLGLVFIFRRKRRRGQIAKKGSAKYSPLDPFMPRPRGEVTVIPLANQTSPPHTASSYHPDTFSHMQSSGHNHNNPRMSVGPGFGADADDPFISYTGIGARIDAAQMSPPPPTTHSHAHSSAAATTGTRNTQWDARYAEVDGETSPPSYDDVTGGQGPTHISYVVQR